MALLGDSVIYDLALATIFFGTCLYLYLTSTFNYWKDRGVAYVKPTPFIGNMKEQLLGIKTIGEIYQGFYNEMKNERYFGFFELKTPVLMIRDPELVERILIKDFYHFYDRGFPADPEFDPIGANLFTLGGKHWRNLRYKLTPTFTTGKLKFMFEQICNSGDGLIRAIEEESKKDKIIDSKPLLSNFAFDVIASVAFGLQLNKDSEENENFRKVVQIFTQPGKTQMFRFFSLLYLPKLARKMGVKQFSQDVEDRIMSLVRATLNYRITNNVTRNDFLQLLLNIQKQEKEGTLDFEKDLDHNAQEDDVIDQMEHAAKHKEEETASQCKQKAFMTESIIAAQSFAFLSAGSESIASTVLYALFSLSQNPEIQENVQNELDSVLASHNNKWSYEAVKDMVYLEQVLQETLRLYPVAPFLMRKCTEPYKIPNSTLVVEKGTRVLVPILGLHHDPQHYENPEVFDPDRFQGNNFKPSGTYLPFGDGPRICIAMRFAVLEVKVIVARILAEYSVTLNHKTKLPITFNAKTLLLFPQNKLYFEFAKRVQV